MTINQLKFYEIKKLIDSKKVFINLLLFMGFKLKAFNNFFLFLLKVF